MAHKRRDRSASDRKEMGTPFVCNDGVTIAKASVMAGADGPGTQTILEAARGRSCRRRPTSLIRSPGLPASGDGWRSAGTRSPRSPAAVLLIKRPSRGQRVPAIAVALPLVSVTVLAWWSGNPFNGTIFAVLTVAIVVEASRLEDRPLDSASPASVAAGSILVIFGFVYPHFLPDGSQWSYLYAAPFGLIPCPTLSVMTGASLAAGVFGSRAWGFTLGVVALAYGVIGVVVLGVAIDAALVAGAVLLLAATALLGRRLHRGTPPSGRDDQHGAARLADDVLRG
jgi:hypothetical protein